ncbi:MAG: sugar kinase [Rhodoglobus sp.]
MTELSGGVVTIGETMGLFHAASLGSLAQVSDFHLGIGGAESNVAIGLARLGVAATWVGRVGRDGIGERVLRELRAEGVTVAATVDRDARTGLMVKERRTPVNTSVIYYRSGSAGSRLGPDDLRDGLIENAAVLHVSGITPALSESAADTINAAIDRAVAAGVPVSFDVNHRATLWKTDPAPVYRAIAARATMVFAGDEEAALFVEGTTPAELAHAIAALGPSQVIIKLGPEGCHALIDSSAYSMAAIPITPLDTVGAGDAFVAGYLAEFVAGSPPEARLATAVRTGAFACLGPGDWESYARTDELRLLDGGDPVAR